MKNLLFICLSGAIILSACGHSKTNNTTSDTTVSGKKGDTSVVTSNQKNVKSDSIQNGDPAAQGNEDPTAHLPKK